MKELFQQYFENTAFKHLFLLLGETFFTCEKFPQRLSDVSSSKTRLEHEDRGDVVPTPLPTFEKVGQNFYGKTSFSRL